MRVYGVSLIDRALFATINKHAATDEYGGGVRSLSERRGDRIKKILKEHSPSTVSRRRDFLRTM